MQADAEAEKKPMQVLCVMRDFLCAQVCLDCIFMVYLSSFVVLSIFSALVTQFSENKIKDTIQRFFLVFCCSSLIVLLQVVFYIFLFRMLGTCVANRTGQKERRKHDTATQNQDPRVETLGNAFLGNAFLGNCWGYGATPGVLSQLTEL